jgi:cyclopentanol dehydrogenase
VETTIRTYGKLTILVNNAGIFPLAGVEATTMDLWHRVVAVNQTGVWLGMKAAIPAMRRSGGGAIMNISSVAGLIGSGLAAAYHSTKGTVRLLTKTAALDYAQEGIRINSVHPGGVDTVMLAVLNPEGKQGAIQAHPLGRLATPLDIAYGVLYLASDEASFVTGAALVIDGGYTAQ